MRHDEIEEGVTLHTRLDLHPDRSPDNRLPAGSEVTAVTSATDSGFTAEVANDGSKFDCLPGWVKP